MILFYPLLTLGRVILSPSSGTNPGGPIPIATDGLRDGNVTLSALNIVPLARKFSLNSCSLLATLQEEGSLSAKSTSLRGQDKVVKKHLVLHQITIATI